MRRPGVSLASISGRPAVSESGPVFPALDVHYRRLGRRLSTVLVVIAMKAAFASAQPTCPGTATLAVWANNLSQASTSDLALTVHGDVAVAGATCVGAGLTTYDPPIDPSTDRPTPMHCDGSGFCGQIAGL